MLRENKKFQDETDFSISMGFNHACNTVVKHLPHELFYLATLSTNRNYPYCVEPPKEAKVSGVLVTVTDSFAKKIVK